MKKLISLLIVCSLTAGAVNAQNQKYSTFYYQRATLFEVLPVSHEDIIFLGNSITNGAEWSELFANPHIKNRGISGDTTMGVYDRLDAILKGSPAKIFLLIGINDLSRGIPSDTIIRNIRMIVEKVEKDSPRTKLYLQSMLPLTDHYKMFGGHTSHAAKVPEINAELQELAAKENVTYIDLYSHFLDTATGKLNLEYTNDGLHLLGKGYLKWKEIVISYVNE